METTFTVLDPYVTYKEVWSEILGHWVVVLTVTI
jgi:hypothetical protein